MPEESGRPSPELGAMTKIEQALEPLEEEVRKRVLRWALDRYGASAHRATAQAALGDGRGIGGEGQDLADFFAGISPKTQEDRALVVGYWMQFQQGETELDAQRINGELKNLGHPVANITSALEGLKARKPQLVMQTKKSGSAKQARKKYKLTLAGKKAVEEMRRIEEE